MIKKCPCENCITFPICRNQIRNMQNPDVTQFSGKKPCELLEEYVYADSNNDSNEIEIDIARDLFGIGKLYEGLHR